MIWTELGHNTKLPWKTYFKEINKGHDTLMIGSELSHQNVTVVKKRSTSLPDLTSGSES